MAVLGILSLFQITLLPGLILLAAAKYRGSLLRRMLISFGLSLTANYVAVFALAAVGLYQRPVVFVIFGAELVVIARFHAADIKRWFSSPLFPALIEPATAEIHRLREVSGPGIAGLVRRTAATAVALVAFIQIGQVLVTFVANWGTIFTWEDAVFSWNRWAVDWFHNSVPAFVYHYPQLIPTNWSISYVFMDMPLQYIAKGMMPLFMLALMLAMLDVAWTRKTAGPYLAPIVAAYLYQGCRIPVTEGGGDLPVSCMVFLSFWCVVAAQRESADRSRTFYLVIGAVLAAAAAVTKQPGLFFLPIYPALAYAFGLREQSGAGRARALRLAAFYIALLLVMVAPSYIHAEVQIHAGRNKSELLYVTGGIFAGTPIPERIVNGARLFLDHMGSVPTFLMVLLALIALSDQLSRWMIGLIAVPWVLLWAALSSYDLRNLALAIPFIAMSVGAGAAAVVQTVTVSPLQVFRHGVRRLAAVRAWVVVASAAALIAAGIGLGLEPTPERLIAHHRRLERELGNPALNAQLYALHEKQPFSGLIVTSYPFLLKLPELGHLCVLQNFVGSPPEPIEFAEYLKNLVDPRVGYFLLPINAYPSILRDVEERLQRGDFKLLFRAEGYLFVEIIRR